MSSPIYNSFALKPLRGRDNKENVEETKIKTVQNTFAQSDKKRKSTPDLPKLPIFSKRSKSSKSFSEMFYKNHREVGSDEFGSSDTLKAANDESFVGDDLKKPTNVQSTPTSTLDDGYESSNSTPLVSGIHKLSIKIVEPLYFVFHY